MKTFQEIKTILEEHPEYKDALYCRGYYLTDDKSVDTNAYPFYGMWKQVSIGAFLCLVHPYQTHYVYEQDGTSFLLIGHAYNPFNMCHDENKLLEQLANVYLQEGKEKIFEVIDEWTGIFALYLLSNEILAVQDCGGIKAVYYGIVNGKIIFTSFPQIAADLYGLEMDPFIRKLVTN